MRLSVLTVLLVTVLLFVQHPAHAYLDPSSGSILIQIILGGIAGFFVLLKIYWRRIRRALGLYKAEATPADSREAGDE